MQLRWNRFLIESASVALTISVQRSTSWHYRFDQLYSMPICWHRRCMFPYVRTTLRPMMKKMNAMQRQLRLNKWKRTAQQSAASDHEVALDWWPCDGATMRWHTQSTHSQVYQEYFLAYEWLRSPQQEKRKKKQRTDTAVRPISLCCSVLWLLVIVAIGTTRRLRELHQHFYCIIVCTNARFCVSARARYTYA